MSQTAVRGQWAAKLLGLTDQAEQAIAQKDLSLQMQVRQALRELLENSEVPQDILQMAMAVKEDLSASIIDGSIARIAARNTELRELVELLKENTAQIQNARQAVLPHTARIASLVSQALAAAEEFKKMESQVSAQFNSTQDQDVLAKMRTVMQSLEKANQVVQGFRKEITEVKTTG